MTHRQPAAFGSPVFSHPCPVCFPVLAVARQISGLCRAPPDLRPLPRPARSPATARPARPLAVRAASFARRVVSKPDQAPQASRWPPIGRRLRTCYPVMSTSIAHPRQNSPSTRTTPVSQPYFRAVAAKVLSAQRSSWDSPACDVPAPDRAVKPKLSSQEAIYCRQQCVYLKIVNHSV